MDKDIKGNAIEFDKNKCIKCTKCVLRCSKVSVSHLKVSGIGKDRYIDKNETNPCILCGQCTLVCPVNAIKEVNDIEKVKQELNNSEKIVIVQCAPAVRASIGELFGMESNAEKKLNTAFRLLKFDKIFDVNFGADITTLFEAEELTERIEKNENLPMFTSCCPAWVEYIEKYESGLKNNLTTAKSPNIYCGMAYKTWWAKKENIDPKNIVVVAIMPCTAKKYEIVREDSKINGVQAVDYVLTVRELGKFLKEEGIDLKILDESEADKYSEYTGAAAIYGTSGGVMESALRTAYFNLTGKELDNIEFESVRAGFDGFKSAKVKINNEDINVAVVSGINNIKLLLEDLKKEPHKYDYIEVMNCVGGCVNGGGQPLLPIRPTEEAEVVAKRRKILYDIDKSSLKRKAHENLLAKEYFNWEKNH